MAAFLPELYEVYAWGRSLASDLQQLEDLHAGASNALAYTLPPPFVSGAVLVITKQTPITAGATLASTAAATGREAAIAAAAGREAVGWHAVGLPRRPYLVVGWGRGWERPRQRRRGEDDSRRAELGLRWMRDTPYMTKTCASCVMASL